VILSGERFEAMGAVAGWWSMPVCNEIRFIVIPPQAAVFVIPAEAAVFVIPAEAGRQPLSFLIGFPPA
jgi:hypothetical protein